MKIRAFGRHVYIWLWLRFTKRSNSSKLEKQTSMSLAIAPSHSFPFIPLALQKYARGKKGVTSGIQCLLATYTQPADTNWLALLTWQRWRRPASAETDGCISRANNCSSCTSREVHRDAALFRGPRPSRLDARWVYERDVMILRGNYMAISPRGPRNKRARCRGAGRSPRQFADRRTQIRESARAHYCEYQDRVALHETRNRGTQGIPVA